MFKPLEVQYVPLDLRVAAANAALAYANALADPCMYLHETTCLHKELIIATGNISNCLLNKG